MKRYLVLPKETIQYLINLGWIVDMQISGFHVLEYTPVKIDEVGK